MSIRQSTNGIRGGDVWEIGTEVFVCGRGGDGGIGGAYHQEEVGCLVGGD